MPGITTNANALHAVKRFQQFGRKDFQAYAIVGNDYRESLMIPAIEGDKGLKNSAHGIAQWRGSRFEALQAFAVTQGKPWTDLDVQINFQDHELRTTEKAAGERVAASTTLEEAVKAAIGYHRPRGYTLAHPEKGEAYAKRLAAAQELSEALTPKPATAAKPSPAPAKVEKMDTTILAVQTALKAAGFDPGPLDGDMGRKTIKAITAFQVARKLTIKFPGTLGPVTLGALLPKDSPIITAPLPISVARPWLDLAITKKGLNENKDKAKLIAFLKSDGKTLGDPSKNPWCGDFVQTCIAITLPLEPLPLNPYLARNWTKFGVHVEPTLGAIAEFWRGKKTGTLGHVAILVGQDKDYWYVLGGNQDDTVSVTKLAKGRLLDTRWPATMPLAATFLPQMVGGKLSLSQA